MTSGEHYLTFKSGRYNRPSRNRIMNPKDFYISVILPVFNGEDFISDAIKNIHDQNYN